jgi:hypothetical protein
MNEQIPSNAQEDGPRTLRDPKVLERRKAMLAEPHIAPLVAYVAELRRRGGVEVPQFDPLDGGVDAQILFLFEKPGPMTAENGERAGSGFISRNNDDATAEAIFRFMIEAEIPRKATMIWNLVPWWNGTRKITSAEVREGAACCRDLIGRLPNLSAVVMVGEKAGRMEPYLETTRLKTFRSCHPSPLVRARYRSRWDGIRSQWAEAMRFVAGL